MCFFPFQIAVEVERFGHSFISLSSASTFAVALSLSSLRSLSLTDFVWLSWHKELELEMSVTETPMKAGAPQIVKLDKALKLAELWVNNMSKGADEDRIDADLEGRTSRLGLGAKVSRQSKVVPSDDPVERKLCAKLNAEKRKAANIAKESTAIASDALDDDEDSENLDSRTNAFTKRKATAPFTSSVLQNKKHK
ncbi:hypothetical protein VNO78_15301 [Psophocarpus tetragonolobus]|uniref:Uncharacterized protein n=1 Tax=Psophocarpus tetragonolobus TaxID=3891 RepID=A0AAN9SII2_PSOTE